jgi:hypothetical protein
LRRGGTEHGQTDQGHQREHTAKPTRRRHRYSHGATAAEEIQYGATTH